MKKNVSCNKTLMSETSVLINQSFMKKTLIGLFGVALLSTPAIPVPFQMESGVVCVAEAADDGFVIDQSGVLTWYWGDGGNVVIPDNVKAIGPKAFEDCTTLTSLVIPGNVKLIDDTAFVGCTRLTSVDMKEGVMDFGTAFAGRERLMKITIPSSVKTIDDAAFSGCSGLTSLIIPESVTAIGDDTFSGCSGLANITIPDSVTSIGDSAFYGCCSLASITFPDGVTSIGEDAFYGCSSLASIVIPDGVEEIGYRAFGYCAGLTKLKIRSNLLDNYLGINKNRVKIELSEKSSIIPNNAFYDCSELTSIIIPNGVTSIGENAFYGCSGLTSIVIPDGVTDIGAYAFYGCSGLTSIVIPDGVTRIGYDTFRGCSGLTSIVIPDGVTYIGDAAFYGCSGLKSINIPDGVTYIGDAAFYGCSGLTSLIIPDSVEKLGDEALTGCSNLAKLTIRANLLTGYYRNSVYTSGAYRIGVEKECIIELSKGSTEIPEYALCFRRFQNFVVPDGVTSIGERAFWECILESIQIPDSVTSIGDGAFSDCWFESITLRTDVLTGGVYKSDGNPYYLDGCRRIGVPYSKLVISSTSTVIPFRAFNYRDFSEFIIPEGVVKIDDSAFIGCAKLTSINIPDGVTFIGASAFDGCSSLVSINIPDGVTSIGNYAFDGCSSLVSINIPDGVTSIGNYAFYGCSSLVSINIPDGVTSIGVFAFRNCEGLKKIGIPDSVSLIGHHAFEDCGKEEACLISVPKSVKYLGEGAFRAEHLIIYYAGSSNQWRGIRVSPYSSEHASNYNWKYEKIYYNKHMPGYHYLEDEMIVLPATYSKNGLKKEKCYVCGEEVEDIIPKLDIPFSDVKLGSWHETTVRYMLDNKLMSGKTATTFEPSTVMNRGQLVAVLWNMSGKPKVTGTLAFSDVATTNTFYNAILWASQNKIVNGYATGEFKPKDPLTRQQIATILYNYAKFRGIKISNLADISTFKDVDAVSSVMTTPIRWAVGNKIISGKSSGTMLDPKGAATRIEVAAMVMNFCKNIIEKQ